MDVFCHSGEDRNLYLKNRIAHFLITFAILTMIGTSLCELSYASEQLQSGNRYKIVRPLYLIAEYYSLNNRKISRETARAYLESQQTYKTSWVAFRCEVPVGTIMTIIGPAPKVWHIPFLANRYFIRLDPDLSRGLDVVLELNRGIEGDLDGLNPKLFSGQEKQVEQPLTQNKEVIESKRKKDGSN